MIRRIMKAGSKNISLFRAAGIEVNLDYSWFIIFLLMTWSLSSVYFPRHFPAHNWVAMWIAGTVTSVLFFLSIVLHEFAHSVVAMKMGISIREITLFLFGGASRMREEVKTPRSEFLIACSGPFSNIVLGLVLMGFRVWIPWNPASIFAAMINYLAWINISIGVFNLIPAFPLDGGRMLRAVVWWKTGSPSYSFGLSTDMGKGFSLALIVLGALQAVTGSLVVGLMLIVVGLFLRSMTVAGIEGFALNNSLERLKVRNFMIGDWVNVPPDISVEKFVVDYLLTSNLREFPVQSGGKIVGTVSLDSIFSLSADERKRTSVYDIMVPASEENEISPEANLLEASRRMNKGNINRLLVMEKGEMVGMLTRNGMIRLMELRRR
jgi:Zn-dependent protease/predicted transcriptional regulator